ncbi:hypothetical protein DEM27_21340 [Metarhizobium album]|uniref:Amidohydrolase 3 domain-containing protein n=2 Tax=Metarhizobium album TaxID=2182425 RepID=A0A2U2DLV0_9HYPH|nr:hypothetical protein DEM27_21340 [Rhizobium album]
MNPAQPVAEALAVDAGGRILGVGSARDLQRFVDGKTQEVDLAGRFVMPGIFDFHLHVIDGIVLRQRSFPIDAGDDFDTILESVRQAAASRREEGWLIGGSYGEQALGYIQSAGPEAKRRLNEASGDRPLLMFHVSQHGAFVNDAALREAGIHTETPDPPGGRVVRVQGEATGLLEEHAMSLVTSAIPEPTDIELIDLARAAVQYFNSVGMTGFVDAMSTPAMLRAFRALDDAGELSAWSGFTLATRHGSTVCSQAAKEMLEKRKQICGPHMIAENAKIFLDGVPSLRTAAMISPYPGVGGHGEMYLTPDELFAEIAALDRQGVGVKVHAIGDAAVARVLDAVAKVRRENGDDGPRHHIAHGQFLRHEDIGRMKQLRVIADLNPPLWFVNHASLAHERVVGAERYSKVWPIRTMLEAGVTMALGSDWLTIFPEIDPWKALAGLLTRRDPSRKYEGVHAPQEAITLDQALPLMTCNPAEGIGLGERTGRLEVGMSADMIVLDRDLYAVSSEEIAGTHVLKTYFEGRQVYSSVTSAD